MDKQEQKSMDLLSAQLDRLKKIDFKDGNVWKVQTLSSLREFFGEFSEEYKFIENHSFKNIPLDPSPIEQFNIQDERLEMIKHLENCIEKIKEKPVFKKAKPNFLFRIREGWLILWITMACAAMIAIGKALSDYQNVELKLTVKDQQNVIDSLSTNRSTASKNQSKEPFSKDRKDTIIVHDTIYIPNAKKSTGKSVQSINQKGGQTAFDIKN